MGVGLGGELVRVGWNGAGREAGEVLGAVGFR